MAAQTYRDLISALQTLNKEANADKDITDAMAIYLIGIFVNKYKYTKLAKGNFDYGKYLHIDPLMTVLLEPITKRKYVELPTNLFNLPDNKAIHHATFSIFDENTPPQFVGQNFFMTTPAKAMQLYYNPYTTPSLSNVYGYVSENRCYFLGLETALIQMVEFGMFLAFQPFDANTDMDTDIEDVEIADYILRSSLDMIRYMLIIPSDRKNDGSEVHSANTIPKKFTMESKQPQPNIEE